MYVGHTYKKSKNMTCNIQKKYKKNIKMKNLVHVVNLSLDYWTLNGMPTINNEIFFLSLYQVYYYCLYLVKLLHKLSVHTHCHLSQKNTLSWVPSCIQGKIILSSSAKYKNYLNFVFLLYDYTRLPLF